MGIYSFYADPAENFMVWNALLTFAAFLLAVLAGKLAARANCHAPMHRLNFRFFALYAAAAAAFCAYTGRLNLNLAAAFAIGAAIYFSLHRIYLMALVGLAKRSVSVNLLETTLALPPGAGETALLERYARRVSDIREDRLNQMVALGLATRNGEEYTITPSGRLFDRLGNLALKLWGLRRPE